MWKANKPELVEPALLESLERLQMEYVDLYLIQLPVAFERDNSFDTIKVTKDGLVCLEATNHINVWKVGGINNNNTNNKPNKCPPPAQPTREATSAKRTEYAAS